MISRLDYTWVFALCRP